MTPIDEQLAAVQYISSLGGQSRVPRSTCSNIVDEAGMMKNPWEYELKTVEHDGVHALLGQT
ncbi:hypothetical protein MJO28_010205 [Puccinia striiformis f. sp. tritici]|uniref:Uncharacterized protein n=1 Tax=Puccinia striiformis f. sp. tritici TaxID=168172 RepID=A0ACC0E4C3_9BASI|nr:hypothetical protein MJO28_010205 [Puccinia striiformis f. sp. tritici]